MLGRSAPRAVRDWASGKVKGAEEIYAGSEPEWERLFDRLELGPALQAAGYEMLT